MPILVLAAALAFTLSPLVSDGFNGFTADQFPVPQDEPPVQPAGYAFSIWGLIYLWLIVHAGYGLARRRADPGWQAARPMLLASLAVGAVWIPVANASPLGATLLIWVMLLTALAALIRAGRDDRWLLETPLGLYAGWLTAASFVSLALVAAGWGFVSETVAAWAALFVALAVATAIMRVRPAPGYAAAFGWALIGVAVQNGGTHPGLTILALAGAVAMAWLGVRAVR